MKKPKIWCDITCIYCGSTAHHSGPYSPERIKLLKQEIAEGEWRADEDGNPVCAYCYCGGALM